MTEIAKINRRSSDTMQSELEHARPDGCTYVTIGHTEAHKHYSTWQSLVRYRLKKSARYLKWVSDTELTGEVFMDFVENTIKGDYETSYESYLTLIFEKPSDAALFKLTFSMEQDHVYLNESGEEVLCREFGNIIHKVADVSTAMSFYIVPDDMFCESMDRKWMMDTIFGEDD